VTSAEEFTEFAEAVSPRLRRMAFLLCGDWHTAADLAQTALAKVFVSWRTIRRQDAVHAYATRTLVSTYLAHRRLKRNGEVLSGWLPEAWAEAPAPETRMVLLDALAMRDRGAVANAASLVSSSSPRSRIVNLGLLQRVSYRSARKPAIG
jgi:DNA-directed RNA polymerase specialized sigma24 family protein